MKPLEAKIAGIICLGLGTLVIGLIPACFKTHSQQWPVLLSSLLCFGGGVLLSTSMIHMLPEVREMTEYAELLFCAGFFLLYLIDELVHYFWSDNSPQTATHHSHSHQTIENQCSSNSVRARSNSYTKSHTRHFSDEATTLLYRSETNFHTRQLPFKRYQSISYENIYYENNPPSQICHVSHTEPCHDPPVGQVGLLIALCLHSVLEGLAIGLEDSAAKVGLLIGAVASHKLVVGFCLGVELSTGVANTFYKHFAAIAIFAVGSAAGIGIGMTMTDFPSKWSNVAQTVLQGLAGGTLLYVTVSEVLPRERARWHNQTACPSASLVQFFSVALGFVITTLITTFLDFDHATP